MIKSIFIKKYPEVNIELLDNYINFLNTLIIDRSYTEKHHILPRSLFPDLVKDSWNIIKLTAKDHFIAHYWLFKCLPCNKTALAWMMMHNTTKEKAMDYLDYYAQVYQEAKESLSKNKHGAGRKHSEETKQKIKLGNLNKIVSEKTKEKIRLARSKQIMSCRTDETKAKMSASALGKKNALGSKRSEESKKKLSAERSGKKRSQEIKDKISISVKAYYANKNKKT